MGEGPTRRMLQPEATGAVWEVTKQTEASGVSEPRIGGCASVRAVTRVNAEQASKRTTAQADLPTLAGKADITGWMSKAVPPVAVPG